MTRIVWEGAEVDVPFVYAAWGASLVARVLAIPGLIVSFLIALVR